MSVLRVENGILMQKMWTGKLLEGYQLDMGLQVEKKLKEQIENERFYSTEATELIKKWYKQLQI